MDSAVVWMWAVLSAPASATYAVAAANRMQFDEPAQHVGRTASLMVAAMAFGAVVAAPSAQLALQGAILSSALAYLAAYDIRSMSVPVWPVLLFCFVGLGFALANGEAIERALSGGFGYAAFGAINLGYRLLRGRDGLGDGDALVAGLVGVWGGAEMLASSVAIGGVIGIGAALVLRRTGSPLPFVPAFAMGVALTLMLKGLAAW